MAVQGVISSFSSSISSSSLFRLFFCRSWIRWNNFLGVSRWVSFTNQSSPKVFVPRKWPQTSVQFFLLSFLWRNCSEVFLWYKKKKAGEAVAGDPLPLFASCFFCNLRASAAFLQNLQLLCWVKFSRSVFWCWSSAAVTIMKTALRHMSRFSVHIQIVSDAISSRRGANEGGWSCLQPMMGITGREDAWWDCTHAVVEVELWLSYFLVEFQIKNVSF